MTFLHLCSFEKTRNRLRKYVFIQVYMRLYLLLGSPNIDTPATSCQMNLVNACCDIFMSILVLCIAM